MISWSDLYTVLTAIVPLYVAMILAYGSVKWWKIFTPDQCSGINRFVAIFAVPLLSFKFISTNNPYQMNLRFIAADTLQKIITIFALTIWSNYNGTLEWMITIFSLSTLPNTLVMGIPLLSSMYGSQSRNLMVQLVVLQCIIWYTFLLFLFEYRSATMLIKEQFPDTAGLITSFKIDPDVVSLVEGRDSLQIDAGIGTDGKIHVNVRRSNASRGSFGNVHAASRPSNMTGAEIYSLRSSQNSINDADFYNTMARQTNSNSMDLYSVQSSKVPTPRQSNFEEDYRNFADSVSSLRLGFYPKPKVLHDAEELRMFVRSLSASCVLDGGGGLRVFGGTGYGASDASNHAPKEIMMLVCDDPQNKGLEEEESVSTAEINQKYASEGGGGMPPASVMTRLILIMVWRKVIRNPNTYSSLVGLIWSLVAFRWHVSMPKIIGKSISILSDAALGMAMFSLGLFMALQPKIIACGNSVAAFTMAVRFITGPAIMSASSIAVGLRGTLLRIAIVQAALPQGIVPFVFAKEYNVHPTILSTGVIFGMLMALPIALVYYILLGI